MPDARPETPNPARATRPPSNNAPPSQAQRTRRRSCADDPAIVLAHALDDMAGLPYHMKPAHRWCAGRIMPNLARMAVATILMKKAREPAAARQPHGPIRNPAAAFVAWAGTLDKKRGPRRET